MLAFPANSNPTFPEDIERIINEVLLNGYDARHMCATMSLVAPRFHAWTKPITFRTVVIRRHNNLLIRINGLLPYASCIRILAIDLPSIRAQLSEEELLHIRRLLEVSVHVRHLAVDWNLWAQFCLECGALELESLYLIWDRGLPTSTPSLERLQHPSILTDFTIYAPPDRNYRIIWRREGVLFLPPLASFVNLSYVTYAADRTPYPSVSPLCDDIPHLKGSRFVLVDIPEEYSKEAMEEEMITGDMDIYPHFSAAYLPHASRVLGEWVAKVEGRPSILDHPPPHAVLDRDGE
ncbi:hypothetical protein B0H19DRAFT_1257394 [Mycena capillaripes]|nr:hypothetical protein B0H19DRAFT_1257394 [Mycena capillaripes]